MPKLAVDGYGTVDVPADKRLVLAIEQDAKVDVLHACGGNARCTTCRVEFIDGEPTKMTAAEKAVLAAKGLGLERTNTIGRVAPRSERAAEAAARVRWQEPRFLTAPLKTTLIRVNYASAAEMAQQVRATLSPRGTVGVDARTNTLIIRDVE